MVVQQPDPTWKYIIIIIVIIITEAVVIFLLFQLYGFQCAIVNATQNTLHGFHSACSQLHTNTQYTSIHVCFSARKLYLWVRHDHTKTPYNCSCDCCNRPIDRNQKEEIVREVFPRVPNPPLKSGSTRLHHVEIPSFHMWCSRYARRRAVLQCQGAHEQPMMVVCLWFAR